MVLGLRLMSKLIETDTEKPVQRKPSRVREHLANERTYLAWMRTAIALIGFGVVIVHLHHFFPPQVHPLEYAWKLALVFSMISLVTVLLSTQHYFAIRQAINSDGYESSSRWVFLFSLAVILLAAGIIYVVFTAPLDSISSFVPE
jgi:putative membrane protein